MKQGDKKKEDISLRDLSKDELIMAVEAIPEAMAFFTRQRIAEIVMWRKYNQATRLISEARELCNEYPGLWRVQ